MILRYTTAFVSSIGPRKALPSMKARRVWPLDALCNDRLQRIAPGCALRSGAKVKLLPVSTGLAGSSAILGPLLDNYHSAFGVLSYRNPWQPIVGVTTATFVPWMFAFAGVAIGIGALQLDARSGPGLIAKPSVPTTLRVVGIFSLIYYASGCLYNADGAAATALGPVLCAAAFAEWALLDRSLGGVVMGLAAAAAGWVTEAGLVNLTDLYAYAEPEWMGLPLWIAPVYFAGGPAVASVARLLASWFPDEEEEVRKDKEV
jgi:hypothetical protein